MSLYLSNPQYEGGVGMENEIQEIKERLTAIESLLQRLPEIQAAVFLQMFDEYQSAKIVGKGAKDLWEVPNPQVR